MAEVVGSNPAGPTKHIRHTMKKDGGIIINWQFHTIPVTLEQLREYRPDVKIDKALKFSGTVKEDPTGRWQPGYHMHSSLVIDYDPETGRCETENTIYILEGEEGGDIFPDMGAAIDGVFY